MSELSAGRLSELQSRVQACCLDMHESAMVVEQMEDAVVRLNTASQIVGWNRAAERLFGYRADEIIGQSVLRLTPPEFHHQPAEILKRIFNGEIIRCIEVVRMHKDGTLIDVELSLFPLRDETGRIFGATGIVRNIAERKRAQEYMRRLSGRLMKAQEEERRRIARELHDSTAQLLAALSINLGQLCGPGRILTDQRREQLLAECAIFSERALLEVRTQSYLLHPPMLEERGLVPALRFFIEGFVRRSGIEVNFRAPDEFETPESVALALFRVVQEALSNVHRHSESPNVEIAIAKTDGVIGLSIRDFGKGLPKDEGARTGVGIDGLRERLKELGGEFVVESASPGTRIAVTLRTQSLE